MTVMKVVSDNVWSRRLREAVAWCGWESVISRPGKRASADLASYTSYTLNRSELVITVLLGCCAAYGAIYVFYQSVALAGAASLLGAIAPRMRRNSLLVRRRTRFKLQFKEALFSLTSSLAAGKSLENAFRSALDDLSLLYPEEGTDILRELRVICYRLANGEPLETALRDLAVRAQIDEVTQFADALSTCKRSGGDMLEVMKRTSTVIGEKLSVDGEIAVILAQKRFEGRMMMAVPFVFMSFLGLAAPDYMEPLYNGAGYALLTAALLLLLGCFRIMSSIMRIEI